MSERMKQGFDMMGRHDHIRDDRFTPQELHEHEILSARMARFFKDRDRLMLIMYPHRPLYTPV